MTPAPMVDSRLRLPAHRRRDRCRSRRGMPCRPEQVHREEGHVEADEEQPEGDLAQRLAHHPAGHLGEPVGERAEQREDRAADQHVVEVGDDEIGVVDLPVERHRGEHHAGQPADDEDEEERRRCRGTGPAAAARPVQIVAIQQKICMPVGDRDICSPR